MIAGLILAAGESRRMGRDKALLTYHGRTFIETVIDNLRAAGIKNVTVVLGHQAETIQSAINLAGVRVVVNFHYEQGQTSSLKLGLAAVAADAPEGVVLCLVDHPAVPAAVIVKLLERFQSTHPPVVVPTYQCQRGHPVIISQAVFPELLALPPDEPANAVIRKYRPTTQFVEVADPGVLLDIDDPQAYQRLKEAI